MVIDGKIFEKGFISESKFSNEYTPTGQKILAKSPTIKGQNKTTKMYILQPWRNPDSFFCMVILIFEDCDKQSH